MNHLPMATKPLDVGYFLIDVLRGRKALNKLLSKGGRVKVRLTGYIDSSNENDDGTSIEFTGYAESCVEIIERTTPRQRQNAEFRGVNSGLKTGVCRKICKVRKKPRNKKCPKPTTTK